MTTERIWTKDELRTAIDAAWAAINDALDALPPERMTSPVDDLGWAVTDHLSHMAAWNGWAFYLFQGQPPWEGMGISEADYKSGDGDARNAAIFARHAGKSPDEARAFLCSSHDRLMALFQPLTDADLAGPYRPPRPDEPAEQVIPALGGIYHETTAEHYADHLGWFLAPADRAEDVSGPE